MASNLGRPRRQCPKCRSALIRGNTNRILGRAFCGARDRSELALAFVRLGDGIGLRSGQ